jgi:hypothetical protein
MVAWVGGAGIGVAVGIGGPAVGWFPLGPREVFVPAYGYSPAYMERINVTNTVIVNRGVFVNYNVASAVYVNRGVVGAVTVVPGGVLAAGRPVAAAAVVVRPEMIARVQVTSVAAVVPERAAVFGGRAETRVAPPAAVVNRTVVTRMPPPARPVAFDRQQEMLRANPGRPLDAAATRNLQRSEPVAAHPAYRPAVAGANSGSSRSNTQHNIDGAASGSSRSNTQHNIEETPATTSRSNTQHNEAAPARPADKGTTSKKPKKNTREEKRDKT